MAEVRTTPHHSGVLAPVRTLHVEVTQGADTGRTAWSEEDRLSVGTAKDNDLVLYDPTVSRYHLELVRETGGIRLSDPGSTNGTRFAGIRVERAVVPAGIELELGATRLRVGEGSEVDVELHEAAQLGDLVGASEPMRRVMAWIKRAARSDVPVLVTGESGTGKELAARAIHERSARADGPFVTVDCGALAPSLVASELFGHERGAFTGAERMRVGALERASGGTLFLDELGELPLELQPTLLGALERRRFTRVGGSEEVAVDVRIVAATNRDLRSEINAGAFRLDLFYRVAVLKITLPPLRERAEDIAYLVHHFLRELDAEARAAALFDDATLRALSALSWPGNVRELRNMVMASVALEEIPPLDEGAAPAPAGDPFADLAGRPYKRARREALDRFERVYLTKLLEATGDNVSAAARDAGLDRSYFFSLLKRHGLR
ncbi:MAG: sigma 54-dependent Fis family transcriptional regulator [Sandaracinaceae bacterium]|nr:sigma 54-dependent Fis family transcriptional regulator [Sandaracinaceae bacterium]